jgi:hypothetical protein
MKVKQYFLERSLEILEAAGAKKKWGNPVRETTTGGTSDGHLPHGERREDFGCR